MEPADNEISFVEDVSEAAQYSGVVELFTIPTSRSGVDWAQVVTSHRCSYRNGNCSKVAKTRKNEPKVYIGSCSVGHYVSDSKAVIVCPVRFLERRKIFVDCLHLLTRHEPGNEYHVVPEIAIPGGNVDFFLASLKDGKVVDFVGIELQSLDTTGSVFPVRQKFLASQGVNVGEISTGGYGMNWKMSAKTILVQLHHKVQTFEHVNRNFVLVLQDHFLDEMKKSFTFDHISDNPSVGDTMHFHSYSLRPTSGEFRLHLKERFSTDSQGIERCLGVQASPKIEVQVIAGAIEKKIAHIAKKGDSTLFT
ncbi:MAG: hypothetical protein EOO88_57150, partial [Pedobacter sp.]